MKRILLLLVVASLITSCSMKEPRAANASVASQPLALHPSNPHYFLYKGKALAIISSAEHYGAVLNLDFDYRKYLRTLADEGMNYTRMFTGSYFEIHGQSFGIRYNTLAPAKDSIITPWRVTKEPSGKIAYDLSQWNPAYFSRLKDFIATAATHNIIVEVTLFSSIYNDRHWEICPQNPANNINIDQEIAYRDAQTLNNGPLLKYQLEFVSKMVTELNDFDNFFFEIQNEPWADHAVAVYNIVNKEDLLSNDWTYKADFADSASMDWQDSISSVITAAEKELPKKHLIAQNYTNYKSPIPSVSPNVSIIHFHYAWPEAVEWNYHYGRVIGFDESGFAGSGDPVYRRQAWQFMLSGGGLFNNLDYSFYPGHEDGRGENAAPGGGSPELRRQLKFLAEFLGRFELEKLHPDHQAVKSSPGLIPYVLSDNDNTFAIYLRAVGTGHNTLELKAGSGSYRIRTLNTLTGEYAGPVSVKSSGGTISLDIVIPDGEMAIEVSRV